ncbi:MAG TPA: hypothetical protein DDW34_14815 [Clostridium sp.]|nr:hypothetical protein [Clostridium sp.]
MDVKGVYENNEDLFSLCRAVRELIDTQNYDKCKALIFDAMRRYPHSPEPHNLIGILLEKIGEHAAAMKHFRAAWALDPTYLPAQQNLECYGTFYSKGRCAYDERDCISNESAGNYSNYQVEYDSRGIGHFIRRE